MNEFLAARGWTIIKSIDSDASDRRYTRVAKGGRTAVFMDSSVLPDRKENVCDVVRIANWLNEAELKAPAVYEADEASGYALLEDFGDISFSKAIAAGQDKEALYTLAVDVLKHLATQKYILPLPPYKKSFIDLGRRRVIDWYNPLVRGEKNREKLAEDYLMVWETIEKSLPPCSESFLHMDYHLDNLMVVPGEGLKRCGLIDFQDAMKGPQPYDLVNLLEDARTDVPPAIKAAMIKFYVEGMNKEEARAVFQWMRVMGTQFHCRWLGQLIKLALKDNKKRYLPQIPRLQAYIRDALKDPILKPLKIFFQDNGISFEIQVHFDPEKLRPLIAEDAI